MHFHMINGCHIGQHRYREFLSLKKVLQDGADVQNNFSKRQGRERLRDYSIVKKTNVTWQPNAMWAPGLDPETEKRH